MDGRDPDQPGAADRLPLDPGGPPLDPAMPPPAGPPLDPSASPPVPPGEAVPGRPGPPRLNDLDTVEARALAAERDETRRLIEAGAGTPEELRALAERLRAQRAQEEDLWRTAVKPQLRKARSDGAQARRALGVGGGLLGCVALVMVAAATGSGILLLLPLVALLVGAYVVGRRS